MTNVTKNKRPKYYGATGFCEPLMVAWTDADADLGGHKDRLMPPGSIEVIRWPDRERRGDLFDNIVGASDAEWCEASISQLPICLIQLFLAMTVSDGIDPNKAHAALMQFHAYRAVAPADIKRGVW